MHSSFVTGGTFTQRNGTDFFLLSVLIVHVREI